MKPFSRYTNGTPCVPMVYAPPKLDHLYSDEVAARLCREYTKECVDSLVEHMRNKRQPGISLAATNSILDRGYGKPKEIKTLTDADGKSPRIKVQVEFIEVLDGDSFNEEPSTIDQPPQPIFED